MISKDAAIMFRLTPMEAHDYILVRMGMSFISNDQACSNAQEEIPTFDFDAVSQSSHQQFENILNRIRVDTTDVSNDTLKLFYSSVYPWRDIDIVISHLNFATELYRRESPLGYHGTNIRFILLYLGYLSFHTSIIQCLYSRSTKSNDTKSNRHLPIRRLSSRVSVHPISIINIE